MLLSDFEEKVRKREENYVKVDDYYYCKRCSSVIQALVKRVPLHDGWILFKQHCGTGRCIQISIPFCPKCEKPFDVCCLDRDEVKPKARCKLCGREVDTRDLWMMQEEAVYVFNIRDVYCHQCWDKLTKSSA